MFRSIVIASIGVCLCLWVVVSAQQEMSARPGPGSGITNVTGSVSIANAPNVHATQEGTWVVSVGNTPGVRVTEVPSPGFLRTTGTYEITWIDGTRETVTISSIATNGWIEVERSRRWLNLASARAIVDVR